MLVNVRILADSKYPKFHDKKLNPIHIHDGRWLRHSRSVGLASGQATQALDVKSIHCKSAKIRKVRTGLCYYGRLGCVVS